MIIFGDRRYFGGACNFGWSAFGRGRPRNSGSFKCWNFYGLSNLFVYDTLLGRRNRNGGDYFCFVIDRN